MSNQSFGILTRDMSSSESSKRLNTSTIHELKNDAHAFLHFIETQNDGAIIYALEKLGKLENGYSREPLIALAERDNEKIRSLSIKNLAKIGDPSLIDFFAHYANQDKSTEVRREAVSAIGRLRNEKTIPTLCALLQDNDPKVVMQAIRGLLFFSSRKEVRKELNKLANHPNEIIKEVIDKEINGRSHTASIQKHEEFPLFMKNVVVNGDVQEILNCVPDESIHLTFTSPPYYNARDYSIYQSYDEYLNFLENVFKKIHRATKEGRFFILNTSPIIIPRVSRSHSSKRYPIPYDIHPLLVAMGWEFIDDIVWVKPEASVKNRNAGFLQHRKPLAYKPNAITESLMVYRKKTDKLIDWNIKQYSNEKVKKSKVKEKYETTNVWHIDPVFDKTHSAVFPIELCDRVIRYYSFVSDLIFDPFAGSGTVGKSAINLERFFFLTEAKKEYVERIRESVGMKSGLFVDIKERTKFLNIDELEKLSGRKKNVE